MFCIFSNFSSIISLSATTVDPEILNCIEYIDMVEEQDTEAKILCIPKRR
jgi:hypothetical protein